MTKIFGTRFSLIGDIVMSLPILEHLQSEHGDYYMYFSIASKCKQAAPLFLNQQFISEIKISDFPEDLGPEDNKIIKNCDVVFNVKPQHPKEQDWYNYRNCVEETALMAGLDFKKFTNSTPALKAYWNINKNKNSLAIWPFAGYGTGLNRSPTKEWWIKALKPVLNKYKVIHFGFENEPTLSNSENYIKKTDSSFFDQIKMTLDCAACIGTDSGSMWCIGAYNQIPQLNLLTNWLPSHKLNALALAPEGKMTKNLFSRNGFSDISCVEVEKFAYENLCI